MGDASYDVVVIGAGPAGSSAARTAAAAGARVALVDRATFPRYKTCGGGLIGPTLSSLPGEPPTRSEIRRATFTLAGTRQRDRGDAGGFMLTAARTEFDHWLVKTAEEAGADVLTGHVVRGTKNVEGGVLVDTDQGRLAGRWVIGADGASGRVARAVGVRYAQVDLGLEVEIEGCGSEWDDRILLDWGPLPGSYGWVFPKGDSLTVGVIASKGDPQRTRTYMRDLLRQAGLEGRRVLHDSGHLTKCREPNSPLGAGRLVTVGDAAGLLEPWTREGISYAVRSGVIAGRVLADSVARDQSVSVTQDAYRAAIEVDLGREMAAGRNCLQAFAAHPGAFHGLLGSTKVGWRQFCRVTRGETTLADAYRHLPVRMGLGILAGVPSRARR